MIGSIKQSRAEQAGTCSPSGSSENRASEEQLELFESNRTSLNWKTLLYHGLSAVSAKKDFSSQGLTYEARRKAK